MAISSTCASAITKILPNAQRFLYGESRATGDGQSRRSGSALSAFRRNDIAQLRILLQEGEPALLLHVVRFEL
jgi:hypothetical protein